MAQKPNDNDDWVDEAEVNRQKLLKQNALRQAGDTPINRVEQKDIDTFEALGTFDYYQRVATNFAFYPGKGYPLGLLYCGLKLNGEAGELAEHIGKAMRDDGYGATSSKLTEERRALIVKELGDISWYIAAICKELDIQPAEMLSQNLRKLLDRQNRNVQRGSGDNR